MATISKAIAIAAEGFDGFRDKAGEPYIFHCLRVMNSLHTRDEELQQIAMLHDTVEDGIISLEQLRAEGFSERVIRAVDLLTHREGVPYDDYVKALAHNEDARIVKLKDLEDNSKITRLKGLTKKDFDRMEKYHRSYIYLSKV